MWPERFQGAHSGIIYPSTAVPAPVLGAAGLCLPVLPTPGSQQEVSILGMKDMVPSPHLACEHKVLSETPDFFFLFFETRSQYVTLTSLEQVGLELIDIEICLPLVLSAGIQGLH